MEPEPGSPARVHVSCFMKKDEKCLVDRQSPLQAVDVVAELVSVSFLTLSGKPKEKTHYPHYRWLESFFNNKNLWSITISDMRGLSLMFNQLVLLRLLRLQPHRSVLDATMFRSYISHKALTFSTFSTVHFARFACDKRKIDK